MNEAQAIERSESYRAMMNTWAWKDFEENILRDHRIKALEGGIVQSTIDQVQIHRGKVMEIDSILSDLDSIVRTK